MNSPDFNATAPDFQFGASDHATPETGQPSQAAVLYQRALHDPVVKSTAWNEASMSAETGGLAPAYIESQFAVFWNEEGAALLEERGRDAELESLRLEEERLRQKQQEMEKQLQDVISNAQKTETKLEKERRKLSATRVVEHAQAGDPQPAATETEEDAQGQAESEPNEAGELTQPHSPQEASPAAPVVSRWYVVLLCAGYLAMMAVSLYNISTFVEAQGIAPELLYRIMVWAAAFAFPVGLKIFYSWACRQAAGIIRSLFTLLATLVVGLCTLIPLPMLLVSFYKNEQALRLNSSEEFKSTDESDQAAAKLKTIKEANLSDFRWKCLLVSILLEVGVTPAILHALVRQLNALRFARRGLSLAEYEAAQKFLAGLEDDIKNDHLRRDELTRELQNVHAELDKTSQKRIESNTRINESSRDHWRRIFEQSWQVAYHDVLGNAREEQERNRRDVDEKAEASERARIAQQAEEEHQSKMLHAGREKDLSALQAQAEEERVQASARVLEVQRQARSEQIKNLQEAHAKEVEDQKKVVASLSDEEQKANAAVQELIQEKRNLDNKISQAQEEWIKGGIKDELDDCALRLSQKRKVRERAAEALQNAQEELIRLKSAFPKHASEPGTPPQPESNQS